MNEFVAVTTIACVLGSAFTLLMRQFALRVNFVDKPDGRRKLHKKPIALGGGAAVFFATVASVVCAVLFFPARIIDGTNTSFFIGLLLSASFIVVIGLIDDRYQLRGRQKLLGQIAAVAILISSGLVVKHVQIFDWKIELGLLAIPFTMFWLLGAINALNLIDGMDGLAGGVGVILSLAIAGIACMTAHEADGLVVMALCGALLGFLIFNLPPASIYLGDAGSMLIGLLLGALAMRSSFKGPATVALLAPTVIWAIPILDVGMAILRRKLTGRSIYDTDRGHLHHCLQRRGLSGRMTLFWIGLFCTVTAVGALVSVARQNEWLAIISAIAVFATLVVSRSFGYAECKLLGVRVMSVLTSMIPMNRKNGGQRSPVHSRLTGTRDWEELWETLTEYADRFDLCSIQLNVNLPALNEEYHVNWNRREGVSDRQQWTTDIPLLAGDITVGRLKISGRAPHDSICNWMGDIIDGLKPFETQMLVLLSDQLHHRSPSPAPVQNDVVPMLLDSEVG